MAADESSGDLCRKGWRDSSQIEQRRFPEIMLRISTEAIPLSLLIFENVISQLNFQFPIRSDYPGILAKSVERRSDFLPEAPPPWQNI